MAWPSNEELNRVKGIVSEISGRDAEDVRVVVSPYRICPLGAHIDHQGGTVSAMTINKGVLLGFVPSGDTKVLLRSEQFEGEVMFSVSDLQQSSTARKDDNSCTTNCANGGKDWGHFAKGAAYALQSRGSSLTQGIVGYICGSRGLDSAGLSSSAAVGISYLLALESANNLVVSPMENIEYDRIIENEYLGLRNGILDQSAVLLSSHGCLMVMNCKTKQHRLIRLGKSQNSQQKPFKILLAFSGLRKALTNSPGYNRRVEECQEAARVLLKAAKYEQREPLLCNVESDSYEAYKILDIAGFSTSDIELVNSETVEPRSMHAATSLLESSLAKRAAHYFGENKRVAEGIQAWASGNIEEFGELVSASGLSSIKNYECGCEALKDLYHILLDAPGVFGARFSGAGFRGCCLAFVDTGLAEEAASYVVEEYQKRQPELASQIDAHSAVLICEAGDSAHVI